MAVLRNVGAALLLVSLVSSTYGIEIDQAVAPNITIVEFETAYPDKLILKFEDVTTCDLDDEYKKVCKDENGQNFESNNITACVELGCCYVDFDISDDSPRCFLRLRAVGQRRNNQGGYYVIGNKPVIGSGYGYPPNSIPGPVRIGSRPYATVRPTVIVQKPRTKVFRFQWREYTFSFFKIGKTYDEALKECQKESTPSMPSTLLEISNKRVSDYITDKIRSWESEVVHSGGCNECLGYWIGGNDKNIENRWRWETGNKINLPSESGFQNWYRTRNYQEPNGGQGKDCLSVAARNRMASLQGTLGKWFDADCNARRHYICMRGSTVKSSVFNTGTVICAPGSCFNGGACFLNSVSPGYRCRCINGFTGQRCEIPPRPATTPGTVIPTTACCSVASYFRTSCGYRGISGNLCRNQLGCCYNEITKSCFHRALGCPAPTRTTTTLRPTTTPKTPETPGYAYWLKWSGWSKCSRSCGEGRWTRIRGCMGGLPGRTGCLGEATQTVGCNIRPCVVAVWSSWGQWTACSVSCGSGTNNRMRMCQIAGKPAASCSGLGREERPCGKPCTAWAQWGSWGKCSVTCGSGFYSRSRICIGIGKCPGKSEEQQSCTLTPCPIGIWSTWSVIQECTASCGGGVSTRVRVCRGGVPGGPGCLGPARTALPCNTDLCVGWTNWGSNGICTRTCGTGTITRTRSCTGGRPGQPGCAGKATKFERCNTRSCSTWTAWSNVGVCSATCDGGVVSRTRRCLSGSCPGLSNSTISCATVPCSYWSAWSSYGSCSVTCGKGLRERTRECQGGFRGDKGCQGPVRQTITCTAVISTCVTAIWGQWTRTSECSEECGAGNVKRVRVCLGGVVGQTGCQGPVTDVAACNLAQCGKWSVWGGWTRCSHTCGSGQRFRSRTCIGGDAGSPGCQNPKVETEKCDIKPCPEIVNWSIWSEWSDCSVTCDESGSTATRSRFRTCLKTTGNIAVGGCTGPSTETTTCRAGKPCQRDSSTWSAWTTTECSATCGMGVIIKRRQCIGGIPGVGNCVGKAQDVQQCIADIPDCVSWAQWSQWSSCSVTCGKGSYSRSRSCMGGTIGDSGCSPAGNAMEKVECTASVKTCSFYGEWSEYSQCSLTCGGGRQTRTRTCIGGSDCVGESTQTITCNNQECATWGIWGSWGQCSNDCGTGVAKRVRTCIGGDVGAPGCIGRDLEEKSCNTQSCPTWSSWSDYSECSEECGSGTTTRNRTCLNGAVGRIGCEGPSDETRDCNISPCDFWGEWESWSGCSADCDGGISTRSRTCQFGIPGVGRCQGVTDQLQACNDDPCSSWGPWTKGECSVTCGVGVITRKRQCVDGIAGISEGCLGESQMEEDCNSGACKYWGEWQQWTQCSATCNGGERSRMRQCANGEPGENGCEGPDEQTELCAIQTCETWSEWGIWSECSATCGGGEHRRVRECVDGQVGSNGCQGPDEEIGVCGMKICELWSEWQPWGDCSKTCGGGETNRFRECIHGEVGNRGCTGPIEEKLLCSTEVCPRWSDWEQWSDCSVSCGGGSKSRNRFCDGGDVGTGNCLGGVMDSTSCNEQPCPKRSDWGLWTECTQTCNGGTRIRGRSCESGDEESDDCEGPTLQTEQCNSLLCPTWSTWGDWSPCNATCGEGNQIRVRRCPGGIDGKDCVGESMETQTCTAQKCPEWTMWGNWTTCSVTCGVGVSRRIRTCEPEIEGIDCPGNEAEEKQCSEKLCAVWSDWGTWSECSPSCGDGQSLRFRICIGGEPGVDCPGDQADSKLCNEKLCPKWTTWGEWSDCETSCKSVGRIMRQRVCEHGIAGEGCPGESFESKDCSECPLWAEWSVWSPCDVTCGDGETTRKRVCLNGEPGIDCAGESIERDLCSSEICPIWNVWGEWSSCSATCGGGERTRTRECINGSPGDAGCDGSDVEFGMCGGSSAEKCPEWSAWSMWSVCNALCDGGVQTRTRICMNGHLGEACGDGDYTEEIDCNTQDCASWAVWSSWTTCSKSCGEGESQRTRECNNGVPGENGCNVEDGISDTEQKSCFQQTCPYWEEWSSWSECSTTCDGGVRERTRQCINGTAGDSGCEISDNDGEYNLESCNQQLCPRFSDWGEWSSCNASCGSQGIRVHSRVCLNGDIGQLGCEGAVSEDQTCTGDKCAFWSTWSGYSECTESCGGGIQTRGRLCVGGQIGDLGCIGPGSELVECNNQSCAVWTLWGTWSSCSQSCGEATRMRFRACRYGEIGEGGCAIDELTEETELCVLDECPFCSPDLEELELSNGNVSCSDGNRVSSACAFQCNEGFKLLGSSNTYCESLDSQWTMLPPNCVAQCSDVADIVFIIDSSSSIGNYNFGIIRGFVKSLVRRFEIGPNAAQIGALRYNKEVSQLWNLNDYTTLTELDNAIDAIPYDGSGTHTGSAILYADSDMFTAEAGRRPGVPKIAVVITDGVSFDDVSGPSSLIKSRGALVVAVGVGRGNFEQISEIASDPDSSFSTVVESFEDLPEAVSAISNQIKLCEQTTELPDSCPPQVIADILLVVDSSSSIGDSNFDIVRDFIKNVISDFKIGPQAAQFGLVLYNNAVNEYFKFRDYNETADLLSAIERMPYSGIGTRTGMALEHGATNSLSESSGARQGVPKVAVVITDGKSQDSVLAGAEALKEKATVITIGIKGALLSELVEIATVEENVFTTDFEGLTDSLQGLKTAICSAAGKSRSV